MNLCVRGYCTVCGKAHSDEEFPKKCGRCDSVAYSNPKPVAVAIQPVDYGVLVVRRGIKPHEGELALPGGFVESGETWQEALCRELQEETGIDQDPDGVRLFHAATGVESDTLLIFGTLPHLNSGDLPPFVANREVSDRKVLSHVVDLAFSLHTEALDKWVEGAG